MNRRGRGASRGRGDGGKDKPDEAGPVRGMDEAPTTQYHRRYMEEDIARPATPADESGEPSQIGAYRILRQLGAGGMGRVYEAVDVRDGTRVALKRVRRFVDTDLAAIRREVRSLRQVQHPGVVRILADGVDARGPWYAMELLSGDSLATELESQPRALGSRERLEWTLRTTRSIAAALAALHAANIVHGDLKPSNVLRRADGSVVLTDFGLARPVRGLRGRERLEDIAPFGGSVHYLAPEILENREIDPRSDLYALGCIIYELLTGAPPFNGSNAWAVCYGHAHVAPAPPSLVIADLPPSVDVLVLGLLAKQPRNRVGHAVEVQEAVGALVAGSLLPSETVIPGVFRPSLRGRDATRDELARTLAACAGGAGGCIVALHGPSGIGKTMLASEVARNALTRFAVVTGSCTPPIVAHGPSVGAPLAPFRALLDQAVDLALERGKEFLPAEAQTLTRFHESLAALMRDGVSESPRPPTRSEVTSAVLAVASALAAQRPLVIVLDDLQWCDELSRAVLEAVSPGWLAERRIAWVVTCRSDGTEERLLPALCQSHVRRISLTPLDDEVIVDIAAEMLGVDQLPPIFAAGLTRSSLGVPFVAAEILRMTAAEGILRRLRGARTVSPREPEVRWGATNIASVASSRLRGLSDGASGLLAWCAVLGQVMDVPVLERAARLPVERFDESLTELLRCHVLERQDGLRLAFCHDQLREAAYQGIPVERAIAMHRVVADVLAAGEPGGADVERLVALATHHEASRREDLAIAPFDRAAATLLDASSYEDALSLLHRADACAARASPREPVARTALRLQRMGEAEASLGRTEASVRSFERSLAVAGRTLPTDRGGWRRQAVVEGLRTVVGLGAPSPPAAPAVALAASGLTRHFFFNDDVLAMVTTATIATNAARGDPARAPSSAVAMIAGLQGLLRWHDAADARFVEGRRIGERSAVRRDFVLALIVESVHYASFGMWPRALAAAQRAEEIAQHLDDPASAEVVATMLGHIEYFTGALERSQARYERVLRSAEARGHRQHTAWALFSIARAMLARGLHREALPRLEAAGAVLEVQPELQSEIICFGLWALALWRGGRRAAAEARAEAALSRIHRAAPSGFPTIEGYAACAEVFRELHATAATSSRQRALLTSQAQVVAASAALGALFPVTRPAVLRMAGDLAERAGWPAARARLHQAAESSAERLGVAIERGRCREAGLRPGG